MEEALKKKKSSETDSIKNKILKLAYHFKPYPYITTINALAYTVGIASVAVFWNDLFSHEFHQRGTQYTLYYLDFSEAFLVLDCMEDVIERNRDSIYATGDFIGIVFQRILFLLAERYYSTKTTLEYRLQHSEFFSWVTYCYVFNFVQGFIKGSKEYAMRAYWEVGLAEHLRFCPYGFDSFSGMNFRSTNPLFEKTKPLALDFFREKLLTNRGSCSLLRYLSVVNSTPRPTSIPHFDLTTLIHNQNIRVDNFRLAAFLVERKDCHDLKFIRENFETVETLLKFNDERRDQLYYQKVLESQALQKRKIRELTANTPILPEWISILIKKGSDILMNYVRVIVAIYSEFKNFFSSFFNCGDIVNNINEQASLSNQTEATTEIEIQRQQQDTKNQLKNAIREHPLITASIAILYVVTVFGTLAYFSS